MNEIWKDIEGYEGIYKISNLGKVKSLSREYKHNMFGRKTVIKTSKEKILTININQGYEHVVLCKNGKFKQKLLHRLLAKAFIPNPEDKLNINHIDGNGLNNSLENLEWSTQKENVRHAIKYLGAKDNYKTYRNRSEKMIIKTQKENNKFIAVYNSAKDMSKLLNMSIHTIRNYCRNGTPKISDYNLSYLEVLKYEE